jgi:cation/acetate symporter
VGWSLFFIALLYLSAPALAVLAKFEVMNNLVGSSFDHLPGWIAQWARVDASLLSIEDVNGDGIVQFGEIRLGADLIMLATPELGGLPYVVSGLVAAGGWRRRCPPPMACCSPSATRWCAICTSRPGHAAPRWSSA